MSSFSLQKPFSSLILFFSLSCQAEWKLWLVLSLTPHWIPECKEHSLPDLSPEHPTHLQWQQGLWGSCMGPSCFRSLPRQGPQIRGSWGGSWATVSSQVWFIRGLQGGLKTKPGMTCTLREHLFKTKKKKQTKENPNNKPRKQKNCVVTVFWPDYCLFSPLPLLIKFPKVPFNKCKRALCSCALLSLHASYACFGVTDW